MPVVAPLSGAAASVEVGRAAVPSQKILATVRPSAQSNGPASDQSQGNRAPVNPGKSRAQQPLPGPGLDRTVTQIPRSATYLVRPESGPRGTPKPSTSALPTPPSSVSASIAAPPSSKLNTPAGPPVPMAGFALGLASRIAQSVRASGALATGGSANNGLSQTLQSTPNTSGTSFPTNNTPPSHAQIQPGPGPGIALSSSTSGGLTPKVQARAAEKEKRREDKLAAKAAEAAGRTHNEIFRKLILKNWGIVRQNPDGVLSPVLQPKGHKFSRDVLAELYILSTRRERPAAENALAKHFLERRLGTPAGQPMPMTLILDDVLKAMKVLHVDPLNAFSIPTSDMGALLLKEVLSDRERRASQPSTATSTAAIADPTDTPAGSAAEPAPQPSTAGAEQGQNVIGKAAAGRQAVYLSSQAAFSAPVDIPVTAATATATSPSRTVVEGLAQGTYDLEPSSEGLHAAFDTTAQKYRVPRLDKSDEHSASASPPLDVSSGKASTSCTIAAKPKPKPKQLSERLPAPSAHASAGQGLQKIPGGERKPTLIVDISESSDIRREAPVNRAYVEILAPRPLKRKRGRSAATGRKGIHHLNSLGNQRDQHPSKRFHHRSIRSSSKVSTLLQSASTESLLCRISDQI